MKAKNAATHFDKPQGPTLDALIALCQKARLPWGDELFALVDAKRDGAVVARCRAMYAIELIGRCHDGLAYFGVPLESNAATVDARPIVLVGDDGSDPAVGARNLADFLSLIAYAPAAWGNSERTWTKCAAECLERWPVDVPRLREALCALPGVLLPVAPWKLQQKLPSVAFAPPEGSAHVTRGDADAITDRLETIFAEAIRGMDLLYVFDEVLDEGETLRVCVILDAPVELASVLPTHPDVRAPLVAFLAKARKELPKHTIELALAVESLSSDYADNAVDPWQTLKGALKQKPELFAELSKSRRGGKR